MTPRIRTAEQAPSADPVYESRGARLMLWQATERYPGETFAPLGGRLLIHAIASRFAPTFLCETLCGRFGYVESLVIQADETSPVCIQCVAALTRGAVS